MTNFKVRERRAKPVTEQRLYISCRRLMEELVEIVKQIPREYKFGLGKKMEDTLVDMIEDMIAAYNAPETVVKLKHIRTFLDSYGILQFLLYVASAKNWVRQKKRFGVVIELMSDIEQQSTAWRASLEKKDARPEPEG